MKFPVQDFCPMTAGKRPSDIDAYERKVVAIIQDQSI